MRPSSLGQVDAFVEEMKKPHANADELPGDRDGAEVIPEIASNDEHKSREFSKESNIYKPIRITTSDLDAFGYTPGCPRCDDVNAGLHSTKRNHNDEHRLGIFFEYQRTNHPTWQKVKHMFGPDKEEETFIQSGRSRRRSCHSSSTYPRYRPSAPTT